MTRNKLTILLLGLSMAVLALSACGPRVSTPSPDQMQTYVAETIAAQLTRTEIARPSETPTPTLAPTPTVAPVTATMAVPTAAVGLPTSTVAGQATATLPLPKQVLMPASGPLVHQPTVPTSRLAGNSPWWSP